MAPEVINARPSDDDAGARHDSAKADIWSLGVCLCAPPRLHFSQSGKPGARRRRCRRQVFASPLHTASWWPLDPITGASRAALCETRRFGTREKSQHRYVMRTFVYPFGHAEGDALGLRIWGDWGSQAVWCGAWSALAV